MLAQFGGIVSEARRNLRRHVSKLQSAGVDLPALIAAVCRHFCINENDLVSSSRRLQIARARALIGYIATRDLSIAGSEVARQLNVDRSAVSRAVLRVSNDAEAMATAAVILKIIKA